VRGHSFVGTAACGSLEVAGAAGCLGLVVAAPDGSGNAGEHAAASSATKRRRPDDDGISRFLAPLECLVNRVAVDTKAIRGERILGSGSNPAHAILRTFDIP